ncbi:hypothetical protein [Polaribacter septentrionalilitoris]|uniref:hypothetical protein n=1 Tax=Polaribacter septentrionalilitoris TaxID=2494657 RepID=UPI00135A640B|nr:hypothetical protein [Polaribacter septentrionalilitoris]
MKFYTTTIFLLFISLTFAQETTEESNSIESQFDKIFRTSTTYKPKDTPKRYKVIDIQKYISLKENVLDSLKSSIKIISEKENLLKTERDNISKTKDLLSKTKSDLDIALQKENSISLFGIHLSKSSYNLILWSIIILMLTGLFYFIFKYTRSNVLTKEAQDNLLDVEQQFEQHRKKSLEREQKLRRQLQDEINKQRNS